MYNLQARLFYMLSFVLVGIILYYLSPILTPFVAAFLLAYLVDPLVNKLMRLGMPRLFAVITIFISLFASMVVFFLLIIPLIQKQLLTGMQALPDLLVQLQEKMLPLIKKYLHVEVDTETIKNSLAANWMKASTVAGGALKTILHSGFTIFEWITNLFLIPVVTFYLLRDWQKIIYNIQQLLPRSIEATVIRLAKECDEVLGAFFRGQFLVMIALAAFYSLGLISIGLKLGLLIGLLAGLASIVPYLGFIVGISTALIAASIQYSSFHAILYVIGVFVIGQLLESTILTPMLIGDRIGLHPVFVIFAILAGGVLYGFFGILLALPVAAVIMVVVRYFLQQYRISRLYNS